MATMRWGDTLEDDDFDEVTAQALVAAQPAKPTEVKLPPRQVFGPDKDGVKWWGWNVQNKRPGLTNVWVFVAVQKVEE